MLQKPSLLGQIEPTYTEHMVPSRRLHTKVSDWYAGAANLWLLVGGHFFVSKTVLIALEYSFHCM